MQKQDVQDYSSGSKFLHWLIALIVFFMLIMGFFLEDLPRAYQPLAYMFHKSFGLTVLGLMIWRILWIVIKGKPSLPLTVPRWQKRTAKAVQYGLYVFLLAMPMSGWIMSVSANKAPVYFGLFTLSLPLAPNKALAMFMNNMHEIIAWVIISLLLLHILGALNHFFLLKDKVLQSMLPKKRSKL